MNKIIFKYKIKPGMNTLNIEPEAKFLSVQVQGENPVIWMEVNPMKLASSNIRWFNTVPTGECFDKREFDKFLGTFQIDNLVFHLYEIYNGEI